MTNLRFAFLSQLRVTTALAAAAIVSGCIPYAAVSALSVPRATVADSVAAAGLPSAGEALVIASIAVSADTPGTPIRRWGDLDLSVPGAGATVGYFVRLTRLDRRGVTTSDRDEAVCQVGRLCRFATRIEPGTYRLSHLQIWTRDKEGYDPGSVMQSLNYTFDVRRDEVLYIGRMEISRPYLDAEGTPRISLAMTDHAGEDIAAVRGSVSLGGLAQRTELPVEASRGPVRYDPPWQWKTTMTPGSAFEIESE